MCGICGYVGGRWPDLLEPMCRVMAHRGPDGSGTWSDPDAEVGLGHQRLSILDLSAAGRQPMTNEDETIWLSYNGELYNFLELREELVGKGHRFRSHTDTEVLVHLFEEEGIGCLQRLNGMFAFALWDSRERRLVLARDHVGIKPLYYWQRGRELFFASEIKALLRIPGIPRELNRELLSQYLTFLWIPGSDTLFQGIKKLEPGHLLIWQDGEVAIRRWFEVTYQPEESRSEREWVDEVGATLLEAVRRQMVSDVPLGAFLSGGLDSSSIVACMRQLHPARKIRCYTASIKEEDMGRDQFAPDLPYAIKVANHLGIDLQCFELKPDVVTLLPQMVRQIEEPDADPACFPAYLIAKSAREDGTTVLLSGTGGDEVFFGYRSHAAYALYHWLSRFPLAAWGVDALQRITSATLGGQGALPRRLRKLHSGLIDRDLARHMALVDFSSPEARAALFLASTRAGPDPREVPPRPMLRYFGEFRGEGEINRHSHLLLQTFLAAHNFLYTDKTSMASSVEVRVPFVDVELLRLAARIPERYKLAGRTTKHILKRAMESHLPFDVIHRSKTGFGVPLRKWLADDLQPVVAELLSPAQIRSRGLFCPRQVVDLVEENRANRADHAYLIYALLTLEIWQQTFLDRAGEHVTL